MEPDTLALWTVLPVNSIDQLDQLSRFHDQSGFFLNLTGNSVNQRFAEFKRSSGQRPLPLHWLAATLYQQDAAPLDHYCPHSDDGRSREFTLQCAFHPLCFLAQMAPEHLRNPVAACRPASVQPASNQREYHQTTQENIMAEFTLRIDGMHCGSCVRRVTQALSASNSIEVEEVRIGAARIKSQGENSPVDAAISALAKAGFNARLEQ
jgi:copper chaperone